jgi:hypothetical protein
MGIIITVLVIALAALVWDRGRPDRCRRHIASLTHRSRTHRLNKTLKLNTPEPQLPRLPPKPNSPATGTDFQRTLMALRHTHPHKSEAWRWDEAHRILAK